MKKIFYLIGAFAIVCVLNSCDYIKQYFNDSETTVDSVEVVDSIVVEETDTVETADSI